MASKFFALLYRMKYILRWSLMRNTRMENVAEHSYYAAVLAHALAIIRRDVLGKPCDVGRVLQCALYHDMSEILTGDMPTPVKYFNPEIISAYRKIEEVASEKLLSELPEKLQGAYSPALTEKDAQVCALVKAADKLEAYLKCLEERKAGNQEFSRAEVQLAQALREMQMPEVDYFLEQFVPAFSLTLDELESEKAKIL